MPHGTKIATCCYCGNRAALVLTGRDRHELACSACGAPLHVLKSLKRVPSPVHPVKPLKNKSPKRKSRKKSLKRRLFSEALDLFEDLLD